MKFSAIKIISKWTCNKLKFWIIWLVKFWAIKNLNNQLKWNKWQSFSALLRFWVPNQLNHYENTFQPILPLKTLQKLSAKYMYTCIFKENFWHFSSLFILYFVRYAGTGCKYNIAIWFQIFRHISRDAGLN